MDSRDRLIWTSQPDFEEYREDLMADFPEYSEDQLRDILQASNWARLQFDREELAHLYDDSILVIADLGLWDGRKSAYREIESCNLIDCFETSRDTLDIEWFVDKNGDLRCNDYHHDGTNHYLYRVWKDNISETQKDNLRLKLYRGEFSRADVTRCTKRLGDEIGKVYGWTFPERKERSYER